MVERTAEEKVAQLGLLITLGGKEFEVKPLTIRKAMAWRAKLSPMLQGIAEKDGALEDSKQLHKMIVESPDEMNEAVFSYLDVTAEERETLLDSATEEEMRGAFYLVMQFAFAPFQTQRMAKKAALHPEEFKKELSTLQELSKSH